MRTRRSAHLNAVLCKPGAAVSRCNVVLGACAISLALITTGEWLGSMNSRWFSDAMPEPSPSGRAKPVGTQDCAPACLYLACRLSRRIVSLDNLRSRLSAAGSPPSLLSLTRAARDLGFQTDALQIPFAPLVNELRESRRCAILHVNGNHFVVAAVRGNNFAVLDPSRGVRPFTETAFLKAYQWNGAALLLRPIS